MKIGISCFPTIGGSGIMATAIGLGLAERGHEVHFVNYEKPATLKKNMHNVFFHYVELKPYQAFKYLPYDIALASQIMEMLKNLDLDLFHAHYLIPHAVSVYFAKLAVKNSRTKIIATLHGSDATILASDPTYQAVLKFVLEKVNGITAVSEYLKNKIMENLNISNEIEVIYNFVDIEQYKPRKIKEYKLKSISSSEKIILHISNMRKIKRVTDLIYAFDQIKQELPCRLLLMGEGPETNRLKKLCKQLKLNNKVIFLGNRLNKISFINTADVFVLPSEFEGFGLSALEAMSCGIPTIITKNGGPQEFIQDGINGLFIEPGNIKEIGDKILNLLGNDDLHLTISENARKTVVERFEKNHIIDQYEKFYKKIIAQE